MDLRHDILPIDDDGCAGGSAGRTKRTISAAGRQRIAEAQRKRWAMAKRQNQNAISASKPEKRVLSAAARKRISEATKKRWAAYRAQNARPQAKVKTAGA